MSNKVEEFITANPRLAGETDGEYLGKFFAWLSRQQVIREDGELAIIMQSSIVMRDTYGLLMRAGWHDREAETRLRDHGKMLEHICITATDQGKANK